MPNRERLLDTAPGLFNERWTAVVYTNHIAAAASISPGNLYYYFRNKEEIVRALFERLFDAVEHLADLCWLISEFWLPSLEVYGQLVAATQFERGVALTLHVLNPVASPAANADLAAAQHPQGISQ